MKRIVLFLAIIISLSSYGQKMNKGTYFSTSGIGVSFQKFENLNSRIANFPQYKALKDHDFTLTMGSMKVMRNFISSLSVTGGSSLSGDRHKRSSSLNFLSGGLDLGYDVIPGDMIMLYPMVGIGAEGYQAKYHLDNSTVPFDVVLGSPTTQNNIQSLKLTNSFVTYRLGLGFAVKSPKQMGTIGIQAGYTGSFKDREWKSAEGQTLGGAPKDNLSRFQVSLVMMGMPKFMK
ncbi:hypothetical protein BH11BAC4_BH11BAC4_05160 [soil metagenome]